MLLGLFVVWIFDRREMMCKPWVKARWEGKALKLLESVFLNARGVDFLAMMFGAVGHFSRLDFQVFEIWCASRGSRHIESVLCSCSLEVILVAPNVDSPRLGVLCG